MQECVSEVDNPTSIQLCPTTVRVSASLKKKKEKPSLKISSFGAGGIAQVVHHLPSKCEALSSNPSTKYIHISFTVPVCIQLEMNVAIVSCNHHDCLRTTLVRFSQQTIIDNAITVVYTTLQEDPGFRDVPDTLTLS
jgi:hypothetical protein